MFNNMMERVFDTSRYERSADINRVRIAYGSIFLITALFSLYALFVPFRSEQDLNTYATYFYRAIRLQTYPLFALTFFGLYALAGITYSFTKRGLFRYVSYGPAMMVYLGAVSIGLINNIAYVENGYLLIIPLLLGGLINGTRGLVTILPLHFMLTILGYFYYIGKDEVNSWNGLLLVLLISVAIIGLLFLYLNVTRQEREDIEQIASKQRLQIAQLTTSITRSVSDNQALPSVLNQIVHEILKTFVEVYHVQVFLIDESGRMAQVVASTGDVGQKLLARNHSLPVGSVSVIGQVTQRQEAIRAIVGGENSVHRPNDLLPETRLEIAFPLSIGTRNIGALDLQAKSPDALNEEDLTALQAVADSIAIMIDNSRLIEQTQLRLRQNQLLVERMAEAQREVERLNRELTGKIWANYLIEQTNLNVDLDLSTHELESAEDLTASIMEAIERNEVIRHHDNGKNVIAVPLRVRGEVIGALEFEVDQELSMVDIEMLNEVGERFGLAAENNRLYIDSQRVAQREALVNEIGTRIQSANSVDATLAEAARSLRDALKANHVKIQLGTPNNARQSLKLNSGD